jgi:hypothetical protein
MKATFEAVAVLVKGGTIERVALCSTWDEAGRILDAWQVVADETGDVELHRFEGPAVLLEHFHRTRVGTPAKLRR